MSDAGSDPPFTPEQRSAYGRAWFEYITHMPAPPSGAPYQQNGVIDFVFAEMWPRPGLDRRARRLISLTCAGAADTAVPISSHIYGALKSGDLAVDEMNEFVLHFAVYLGWPKASILQATVAEQWDRVQKEGGVVHLPEPKREDFLK